MNRPLRQGLTLVEILVGLGIFAAIAGVMVFFIRAGAKDVQFSSDHLNAVILSQKLSEDLIEEMAVNPYGLETLGIDSTQKNFQGITDGQSVFFSHLEDRAAPWGFIDPTTDGIINSQMQPLYDDIKKFKFALSGDRLADSGDQEERNLVSCNIDFGWETKTGRGEFNSTCLLFSPATVKRTNLAYAINETEIDGRIPAEVYRKPGKTIPEIAAIIGENVETVQALGRVSLIARDFTVSDAFQQDKARIAAEKKLLSQTPGTDLDRQYERRRNIARLWYDLSKSCFLVVAYLAPQFATLQGSGKFTKTAGAGFDPLAIQQDLSMYRIIYEHFVGSIVQARYYYYALLQGELSRYKGGKCQIQTLQKLMDLYRIVAILPTRHQGVTEYRSFLDRMKALADGRNPFLVRLVDQELLFLQNPAKWMERLPNLKRLNGIIKEQVPDILAFIKKQTTGALLGNNPPLGAQKAAN